MLVIGIALLVVAAAAFPAVFCYAAGKRLQVLKRPVLKVEGSWEKFQGVRNVGLSKLYNDCPPIPSCWIVQAQNRERN